MTALRIDCHTHIGVDPAFYVNGNFPYACDYRTLLDQARRNGIDRLMTFPLVSYFGLESLGMTPPPTEENDFSVPYAFENRRHLREIYDLSGDVAETALPLVILDPSRKQKEQIVVLRSLRERYPIRGLKIQATMIEAPIRDLLAEGSGFLDLAAEWNVPILIHSSIAPDDIWSQAGDILDVAEARPDVRFCLAHSCRFDRPSLERIGTMANTWFDCSAHCIHCDCAVDGLKTVAVPDRRLSADYRRPEEVMKALYDLLPDRMMWGSDAPFYSYVEEKNGKVLRLLSSYEREVDALKLLNPAEQNAVLFENTVRFLGQTVT